VDGVKYRKKDGNMRPKPWAMFDSGASYWKSEGDFAAAVKRSELFRANELIKEYLDDLSDSDQRLLYEKLRSQFEKPAPAGR
jgi:Ni,Fe-hydrogenase III large subunit